MMLKHGTLKSLEVSHIEAALFMAMSNNTVII
jgi:hypothetical protein